MGLPTAMPNRRVLTAGDLRQIADLLDAGEAAFHRIYTATGASSVRAGRRSSRGICDNRRSGQRRPSSYAVGRLLVLHIFLDDVQRGSATRDDGVGR
jgi:hypothetical protein